MRRFALLGFLLSCPAARAGQIPEPCLQGWEFDLVSLSVTQRVEGRPAEPARFVPKSCSVETIIEGDGGLGFRFRHRARRVFAAERGRELILVLEAGSDQGELVLSGPKEYAFFGRVSVKDLLAGVPVVLSSGLIIDASADTGTRRTQETVQTGPRYQDLFGGPECALLEQPDADPLECFEEVLRSRQVRLSMAPGPVLGPDGGKIQGYLVTVHGPASEAFIGDLLFSLNQRGGKLHGRYAMPRFEE